MVRLTETLLESYKSSSGGVRNIYQDMNQLTLSIATKCLFGEETPMRSSDVIQNIAGSVVEGDAVNVYVCAYTWILCPFPLIFRCCGRCFSVSGGESLSQLVVVA